MALQNKQLEVFKDPILLCGHALKKLCKGHTWELGYIALVQAQVKAIKEYLELDEGLAKIVVPVYNT